MDNLNQTLSDKIVQSCFNLYNKLPKTGKPIEKEWTVLSCIVKYDKCTEDIEVVSLGTGSKCVGATKMSPTGDILNDSHAEVYARRGFLTYLYENIDNALRNNTSIFEHSNSCLTLKENIKFIFYSSQLPCGDASIIPKGETTLYGDLIQSSKRKADTDDCDLLIKIQRIDNDIFRTGAKCLPHCEQDAKETGSNYHLLGQVRTKPGRGDRTLSVSCSDKIAKWIHLGIQGALISMLCEPIFISCFIFGAGVPYSVESLKRALLTRTTNNIIELDIVPQFYQSTLVFSNINSEENIRPAPSSIVWINTKNQIHEVAVLGRKLGVTKKKLASPKNSLSISKYNIYKTFLQVIKNNDALRQKICSEEQIEKIPYNVMKSKSVRYIKNKEKLKQNFFKSWTVKPDIWDFCVVLNY